MILYNLLLYHTLSTRVPFMEEGCSYIAAFMIRIGLSRALHDDDDNGP